MAASSSGLRNINRGRNGDRENPGAGETLEAAPRPLPLLLRAEDAAALCGTALRTWRTWGRMGKIPRPLHIGRLPFWRHEELKAWVEAGCPDRATWDAIRQ
jgi:prophage regulatory protein